MKTLLCLFILIAGTSAQCLNDRTYSYGDPKQTCMWIRWKEERRQEFCLFEEVRLKCPQSCGLCCDDDPSYIFESNSGELKDCTWVKESGTEHVYCEKYKAGRMVRDACPSICSYCQELIGTAPEVSGAEEQQPKTTRNNARNAILIITSVLVFTILIAYATRRRIDKSQVRTVKTIDDRSDDAEPTAPSDARSMNHSRSYDVEEGAVDAKTEFVKAGVAPDGVSIYWIKHQLSEKVKEQGFNLTSTLYEIENLHSQDKGVLRKIGGQRICPRDGKLGASVVDSIEGEDNVGSASIILNHSWSYSIGDIIDTLWDHCFYNNLDPKRTYVWAGFLCSNLNRYVEEGGGRSLEMHQEFHEPLHTRIYSIGNVLAMISPWIEPVHLRDAWGIFDIFTAIDAGCDLTVVMTPGEKKKLIMEALQHESQLLDLFDAIDQAEIATAETVHPEDKEYIMDMIRENPGVNKVDSDVNRMLRGWAKDEIRKALKYHEGRSKDASKDEDYAFLCSQVGYVLSRVDESSDALALYKRALEVYKNVRGEEHTDVASLYLNTGMVLQATGDLKGAVKEYRKVLDIDHIVYGDEHIETSNTYNSIGMALELDGDLDGAVVNYQKSLDIREKILGSQNPYTAQSYNHIGLVCNAMGHYEDALEALTKSRNIYINVKGMNHGYTAQSYTNIGYVLHSMGDFESALDSFKTALGIVEMLTGETNHQKACATAYHNIGMTLDSLEDYDSGLFHHKVALSIVKSEFGPNHVDAGISHNNVGGTLLSKGDYKEALKEFELAKKILFSSFGPHHHHSIVVQNNIERCQKKISNAIK